MARLNVDGLSRFVQVFNGNMMTVVSLVIFLILVGLLQVNRDLFDF